MPSVSLKYVLIFLTLVSTRNSFIEILILSPQTKAHKETGWSGSSPHTWGIRGRILSIVFYRFIPTYVGHTWADLLKFMSRTVHPHIRGAYVPDRYDGCRNGGSSPHTWGIQGQLMYFVRRFRFIPTYVGHTCCPPRPADTGPVHPHIRGAYGHRTGPHW